MVIGDFPRRKRCNQRQAIDLKEVTVVMPNVPSSTQHGRPASPPRQAVLWVIAALLAVIAGALVLRWDDASSGRQAAWAQLPGTGAQVGVRGIYAFPGQFTRNSYGLFMLDVDTGTLWAYELTGGVEGAKQLRLVAARSWIFDRYLEEYNVADPTPAAVADLVERQTAQQRRAGGSNPIGFGTASTQSAATP
jgi:hypothetical protein